MRRAWCPAEDDILIRLVRTHGKQWGLISSQMENRTAAQVSARWDKCLDPKLTKGAFTAEEDALIRAHVERYGPQNWPLLSQSLVRRSPKQCRERWCNHLNPTVSASSWTLEEDNLIFENHEKYGPKWSLIAKSLPGRTDNAIKNRWNASISKRIQIGANGLRTIGPEQPRMKRKKSTAQRPPPIYTAEPTQGSQIVPLDISKLAPWQLQMLQQMNVLPPNVVCPPQNTSIQIGPGAGQVGGSPSLAFTPQFSLFTPPSPFGALSAASTPGQGFPFGDASPSSGQTPSSVK
jgi:hypothetical protein